MKTADVNMPEHQRRDDRASLGFWIYLMTDCVLFATLFVTYAVLRHSTFGGPGGSELFAPPLILVETLLLLSSSFSSGLATLAAASGRRQATLVWLGITAALGAVFIGMELTEFAKLVAEGNSWQRSGFLSAFFTLVGTHGLHILFGLVWMGSLVTQVLRRGLTAPVIRRIRLLGMFWHFLDIVWIFIFTIVYLIGVL